MLLTGCDQAEEIKFQQQTVSSPPPHFEGTVIAVGDSLTAGLGVAETAAWPFLLQHELQKQGYNWQVVNTGVSGETSSGTLARTKWILAQKPDIVILETGANDGLRGISADTIQENITRAVQLFQKNGIKVILAGMQIVQNLGPDYTKEFAGIYPRVAKETGCVLIPFFLQNVAGVATLNQEDSIHPNEEGHKIIANTVLPYVLNAIRKKQDETTS